MIILVEATFPGTSCEKAAKAWLEYMAKNPPPDYVKVIDMYCFSAGDGYRTLLFNDVEDAKAVEGQMFIAKGMVQLLNNIEGYKAESRMVYGMVDAFEFLGMDASAV